MNIRSNINIYIYISRYYKNCKVYSIYGVHDIANLLESALGTRKDADTE